MSSDSSPSPILNFNTAIKETCDIQLLRVAIYPGGGFAPGIIANGGLYTTNESIYAKDEKISVEFIIQENPHNCFRLLRSNEADIVWSDIFTFNRLYTTYQSIHPVAVMLYGFSSGEEMLLSRKPITALDAISTKTVVTCKKWSNAHYFILSLLKENGINPNALRWRYTLSDHDAVNIFLKGKSDFAAVSSHCKTDSVQKHVILSSSRTSMLLPGFFITREDTIIEKKEQLVKFASGWFKGLEEMRKNRDAVQSLLSQAFRINSVVADSYLNSFLIAGLKENFNFFNLDTTQTPTFERFIEIAKEFQDTTHVAFPITLMYNSEMIRAFIGQKKISGGIAPVKVVHAETMLEKFIKDVSIHFKTGEYTLDVDDIKTLEQFAEKAFMFSDAKILLSGAVATKESANYNYAWGMRFYTVKKYLLNSSIPESRIIIQNIVQHPAVSDTSTEAVICTLGP